jgi:hypothetical protein
LPTRAWLFKRGRERWRKKSLKLRRQLILSPRRLSMWLFERVKMWKGKIRYSLGREKENEGILTIKMRMRYIKLIIK